VFWLGSIVVDNPGHFPVLGLISVLLASLRSIAVVEFTLRAAWTFECVRNCCTSSVVRGAVAVVIEATAAGQVDVEDREQYHFIWIGEYAACPILQSDYIPASL
jgi:hypothetical protein